MQSAEALLEKAKTLLSGLPASTYRIQFHAGFTFRDACAMVPYLRDLGVTHLYASPYLKARPGSTHGYDIVDHRTLNPEIGTTEDFQALLQTLRDHQLGQLLDIVPNHMGVATNDNPWWNDVLENGPSSRYSQYFDIAWRSSPRPELEDKVLLPVLGASYGEELESGKLRLCFASGAFFVCYYDRRFPVAPRSYEVILGRRVEELERQLGAESPELIEYQSILTAIRNLPDRSETDPARLTERQREKEVIKRRLSELVARTAAVREFIESNVELFHGNPGDAHSFDAMDQLLNRQCYRLSYWRVASDEINYRRFFDINDLAALNMERPEVFEATHQLILRLLADGSVGGVRIDHPDGLYDPEGYFRQLQRSGMLALARGAFVSTSPESEWPQIEQQVRELIDQYLTSRPHPLYVLVEKILGASEPLPHSWPVHGTSGYDFINVVNGLFVDGKSEAAFTRLYRDWVEDYSPFSETVYRSKRLVLRVSLASELRMLAHQLDRLAQKHRRSRDFTLSSLSDVLVEVIACFPVYRSYITDQASDTDRKYVEIACRRAANRNPLMSRSLFEFVRDMLLLKYPTNASDADRAEQRHFTSKFQQVTSPVMAKGVEDTAFYVYNRLVSLNEVGGDPWRFGTSAAAVHTFHQNRQTRWPYALSPLSTHDTKRSEDVRARINVLSEMPDVWLAAFRRWSVLNAPHLRESDVGRVPDANEEYLIYQTLVGAWPLQPCSEEAYATFVKRIQEYMVKAMHEAKVHSSWVNPNAEHDQAVTEFVARILDPVASQAFLDDFRPFQARVSHFGLLNSLSQTLLRITCPGVPDTYQGTELWDFSLVDPDNRRPVDYQIRRDLLAKLDARPCGIDLARELIAAKDDGRVKLYVTKQALRKRREFPELFAPGEYHPLTTTGPRTNNLFCFARRHGNQMAIVAVPRLLTQLGEGLPQGKEVWQEMQIQLGDMAGRRWRNVFTDEVLADADKALAVAEVLGHFPVALLLAE